jgi:hypothetical protein
MKQNSLMPRKQNSLMPRWVSCTLWQQLVFSMISRFRRNVEEICALLGRYSASSGNPLPTFRDNISVQSCRVKKSKKKRDFLTLEDGTGMLSRNVGKGLLLVFPIFRASFLYLSSQSVRIRGKVQTVTYTQGDPSDPGTGKRSLLWRERWRYPLPALTNSGPYCDPCVGPLKVIVQGIKRTNVFGILM